MTYSYFLVEGPQDAAVVGKLLRIAGFTPRRLAKDVDPYWKSLIPTTFPHKGDLTVRVQVPAFYQKSSWSVAVDSAMGDGEIRKRLEESLAMLSPAPDGVGILVDADSVPANSRFSAL